MKWGSREEALAQIPNLSAETLRNAGLTRPMAEAWAQFYRNEASLVANPSALPRAELMDAAARLLP